MRNISALLILIVLTFNAYLLLTPKAHAAALTEASIRLDRMGGGVAANTTTAKILVVAKAATVGTETTVKITWPTTSAFTVDATAANHTISAASLPFSVATTSPACTVMLFNNLSASINE